MRPIARQLLLVAALAAAPGLLLAGYTSLTHAPLHYVTSSKFGNFFMAPGWTIAPKSVIKRTTVIDGCQCRFSCWRNTECKAWSASKLPNGTECRMTIKGPGFAKVVGDFRATYFFMERGVSGKYVFGEDNIMYLLNKAYGSFFAGIILCGSIPGHRLGIFKRLEQLEFAESYMYSKEPALSDVSYIDLRNTSEGPAFGDGTLLRDTDMGQLEVVNASEAEVFVHWNNMFVGVSAKTSRHFICQANPLGVEW
nr:uncharacterized protein LOC113801225 [Penaeus vannamei]